MFDAAEVGRTIDPADFAAREVDLRVEMLNAQFDLQRADFPLVLLVDGDDPLACNRILQGIYEWMDIRHIDTHVLHEPGEEERLRPPFWRFWRRLPPVGQSAVFVQSWAQEAIGLRASGLLGDADFEHRIDGIRAFERTLVDDGVLLLKFWYHLPRRALEQRLQSRRDEDMPTWRLGEQIERLYASYDTAIGWAEQLVRATSTGRAPWHVIESTDPLYAGLATAERVLGSLTHHMIGRAARIRSRAAEPASAERTASIRSSGVLDSVDLSQSLDKSSYAERIAKEQARIDRLTTEAHELGLSTVIVFEGWDAAGKGGTIRRLVRRIDPRLFKVVPIGAPSPEELAHHYLWRFWRHVPRAGHITIFDRSWYGRVLVERVEGLADQDAWQRAYEEIRDFEAQLAESDVVVLKFWLHVSADEQLKRFEARQKTPYKKYKLTDEDHRNRERRPEYEQAVDEMVARTSNRSCPWHLISAENKRSARVEVLQTIRKRLQAEIETRRA